MNTVVNSLDLNKERNLSHVYYRCPVLHDQQFTPPLKCDRWINLWFAPFLIQQGIVFGLILKTPIISSLQFVASGLMGDAAFTGGLATALLGLILDFIMITIMAGVFIFSVDRIPLLRRNVILGSILYGFGVFIVMNLIVLPLSAAPALPAPPLWLLIELVLQHILLIGLPLGILVQRNSNTNM